MRRRGFLGALSLGCWPFGFVRAADESQIPSTSRALLGLASKDAAVFKGSCWIVTEYHSGCVSGLLEVAQSDGNGKEESLCIRFALETLGRLNCVQVIPLCIQRLDFVHRTGFASESDLYLGPYPFARCLANFEKVGVDAALDYLGKGNSDHESEQRLALFAYVLQAAYVNVRVKKGTAVDYATSYQAPGKRKSLDEVVELIQLSPSTLGKMIEQ
jgi:hypothetical protein